MAHPSQEHLSRTCDVASQGVARAVFERLRREGVGYLEALALANLEMRRERARLAAVHGV